MAVPMRQGRAGRARRHRSACAEPAWYCDVDPHRVLPYVDCPPGADEPARGPPEADCHKIYREQISTRIKEGPNRAALVLARRFEEAAPDTPVTFTVHELKRLTRKAAELLSVGLQLELLIGLLNGIHGPNGTGHALRRAGRCRAGRRQRHPGGDPGGQVAAAKRGSHGGRPKVIDDDSLTLAPKNKGVPVPEIAKRLTIRKGMNARRNHSAVGAPYRLRSRGRAAW
ncbi:hypothetical protein [Streptomyces sp. NPDC060035]|uniref:hypothetical protein n=1 Tax=Streptomyces sp. NPDC060035 TaxID=3347044 RepID=UPI0036ABBBAD